MVRQRGQVLAPLAQRRERDLDHAQPVVEVLAEAADLHELAQVAVGGRDDAHVHAPRLRGAERADLAVLEHAQQAHLHARLGLADLVEEDRAAVGDLEEPALVRVGPGEGAAPVAEELALEERVGERAAVLRHEAALLARARIMDGARDEVLARAGLAGEQHRRVGLGDLLHHVEDALHGGARAHQLVEAVAALHLAAQVEVLGAQALVGARERARELRVLGGEPVGLERALHVEAQLVGVPGLLDVAVDVAFVHRVHDRVQVRVAGEHDAHGAGLDRDGALQELGAAHAGHHLVHDHERDFLALEDLDARAAVAGGEHAVVVAEGELDRLEDRRLVVDDQDREGVGARLLARSLDSARRIGHGHARGKASGRDVRARSAEGRRREAPTLLTVPERR